MMKYIFTILLFAAIQVSNAQDWVITTKQDTISGTIEIELPDETFEEIVIKNSNGRQYLKAYQFLEFTKDSIRYKTIKLYDVYRIMKVEKSGYLSLYNYRENGSYDFGAKYLLKMDGNGSLISSWGFRKSMLKYLADCETVIKELEDGKYGRFDLHPILDDYNSCIEQKTNEKNRFSVNQDLDNPLIDIINSIKAKLNDSNQELLTLLEDIKNKIAQQKAVPGYLKSALKEQTADNAQIQEEVTELLNSL